MVVTIALPKVLQYGIRCSLMEMEKIDDGGVFFVSAGNLEPWRRGSRVLASGENCVCRNQTKQVNDEVGDVGVENPLNDWVAGGKLQQSTLKRSREMKPQDENMRARTVMSLLISTIMSSIS